MNEIKQMKFDRSSGKLLSSQLVQQLKAAIRRGDYGLVADLSFVVKGGWTVVSVETTQSIV